MARKPKRRPQTRVRRPTGPAAAGAAAPPATATPPAAARPAQGARIGGDQSLVRSVEMSLGPAAPGRRGGRVVLETADPAIPLDRVPYFLPDLARLGIVAAVMVVLLVAGAELIIPLVLR